MTLTLETLRDRYVFESTPLYGNLGALHVPFDELTGNRRTETRLHGALRRNERSAVIGASGSGKSSVMAHVLNPLAAGIAPLVIPVAAMPAATVDSPAHLVDHVVATVARQASAGVDVDAELANRTETTTTTRKGSLAAGWGWIKGDLAREVKRQTEIDRTATFADKNDVLRQVLEIIAADDLQPVLVFDDTDRWLTEVSAGLVRQFLGENLRWLLEFGTGIVTAVHQSYFDVAPQAELLQYLDTQITIPQLTDPTAIAAIIRRRIELYAEIETPDLAAVIDPDALVAIHNTYAATGSLRRAIHVCHTAVHEALDAGDSSLTANHITAAAHAG